MILQFYNLCPYGFCGTEIPTFSLARLPKSFVELYSIVNKVKGRDEGTLLDDADDAGSAETAICLVSGAVLKSGSSRRSFSRAVSTGYFANFVVFETDVCW